MRRNPLKAKTCWSNSIKDLIRRMRPPTWFAIRNVYYSVCVCVCVCVCVRELWPFVISAPRTHTSMHIHMQWYHDEKLSVAVPEWRNLRTSPYSQREENLTPPLPSPPNPLCHFLQHPWSDHQASPGLQSSAAKKEESLIQIGLSLFLSLYPCVYHLLPTEGFRSSDKQSRHHRDTITKAKDTSTPTHTHTHTRTHTHTHTQRQGSIQWKPCL